MTILTPREFEFLSVLQLRPTEFIPREEMCELVLGYPYDIYARNNLNVITSNLRSKLGFQSIETGRKLGFKLGLITTDIEVFQRVKIPLDSLPAP